MKRKKRLRKILSLDNNSQSDAQQATKRAVVSSHAELFCLVAVLSTLTAVLLLLFEVAQAKVSRSVCWANLGMLGKAVLMYTEDNDGFLPAAYGSQPVPAGSDSKPGFFTWCWLIDPYLGTSVTAVERNGGLQANGSNSMTGSWADSGGMLWHCPADTLGGSSMSYGVNAWVTGNTLTGEFRWNRQFVRLSDWTQSESLAQVNHPERVVFAGDTNKFWNESDQKYEQVFTDWERSIDGPLRGRSLSECVEWYRSFLKQDYTDARGDCASPGEWSCKGPAYRHNRTGARSGSAMMLFCDGHVEAVPFGKLTVQNIFPRLPNEE